MEEISRHKNLKNLTKVLMIAVAVLLLAGDAGAQNSSCADLSNVQAWNGSISFTYSNSGSTTISATKIESNIQHSADVSLRLESGVVTSNSLEYQGVQGSETGVVNINDMVKTTTGSPPVISSVTEQGSGGPLMGQYNSATLDANLTTCKYKFTFHPAVNAVESGT
jgi:hypothetical protein